MPGGNKRLYVLKPALWIQEKLVQHEVQKKTSPKAGKIFVDLALFLG